MGGLFSRRNPNSVKECPDRTTRAVTPQLLAILVLVGLALWVRLPSFDGRSLWVDELWRANLILDRGYWRNYFFQPNDETAITAPIYYMFVRLFSAFTVSPSTLRLSSLVSGVAAPAIAFLAIQKTRANVGVALPTLCGLTIALNSYFISYSTELKPYTFEICVHLICVCIWLTTITSRISFGRLALCLVALVLGVLSAANVIFLLPAFTISLGTKLVLHRDKKTLFFFIGGVSVMAALVAGLYVFCWRSGDDQGMLVYWAAGFQSFRSVIYSVLGVRRFGHVARRD